MNEEKRGQGGSDIIEMKDGENLEFVIRPRCRSSESSIFWPSDIL